MGLILKIMLGKHAPFLLTFPQKCTKLPEFLKNLKAFWQLWLLTKLQWILWTFTFQVWVSLGTTLLNSTDLQSMCGTNLEWKRWFYNEWSECESDKCFCELAQKCTWQFREPQLLWRPWSRHFAADWLFGSQWNNSSTESEAMHTFWQTRFWSSIFTVRANWW